MSKLGDYKPKSGVYYIKCEINDYIYIGQSRDIVTRFANHISELQKGVHKNIILQEDFNLYGLDAFSCEILEDYFGEDLLEKETFHILRLRESGCSLYNQEIPLKPVYNFFLRQKLDAQKRHMEKWKETNPDLYRAMIAIYKREEG